MKLYTEESNGNGAIWVVFPGETDEVVEFNSQGNGAIDLAKAALRAASDHLRHKRYAGVGTKVGFHVYTGKNINSIKEDRLAMVSIGTDVDFAIPFSGKDAPELWLDVAKFNRRFLVTRVDEEWCDLRSIKHDIVDMMLLGYTLKVKVAPIRAYWDIIKAQFDEPDDAVAWELRRQAIARRNEYDANVAPMVAEAAQTANDLGEDAVADDAPIMIRVLGSDRRRDMQKLPKARYALHSKGDESQPGGYPAYAQVWEPDSVFYNIKWTGLAAQGYQLVI